MLKVTLAALLIASPAIASDFDRYCPVNPDPNYGESVIPIPQGFVYYSETYPRYCYVYDTTSASLCMEPWGADPEKITSDIVNAGPVTQILVESDNPRIIMGGEVFIPCKE